MKILFILLLPFLFSPAGHEVNLAAPENTVVMDLPACPCPIDVTLTTPAGSTASVTIYRQDKYTLQWTAVWNTTTPGGHPNAVNLWGSYNHTMVLIKTSDSSPFQNLEVSVLANACGDVLNAENDNCCGSCSWSGLDPCSVQWVAGC